MSFKSSARRSAKKLYVIVVFYVILKNDFFTVLLSQELLSSPAARAAATKSLRATMARAESLDDEKLQAENMELKKSLAQANKQVEELRRKTIQSQDENKKLERTLAKELGDGHEIEQVNFIPSSIYTYLKNNNI